MTKKISKRKSNKDIHPIVCPRCSKPTGSAATGAVWMALPVTNVPIYTESAGKQEKSREYLEAFPDAKPLEWTRLKDKVPLIAKGACAVCLGTQHGMKRLVDEGGIYVSCRKCNHTTALSPDHALSKEFSKKKEGDSPVNLQYAGCDVEGTLIPTCKVFENFNIQQREQIRLAQQEEISLEDS